MKPEHKEILDAIELIKQKDPNFEVFGSEQWEYTFRQVAEWDVLLLEEENEIGLPQDFREFLLEVGFGPGPAYGAYPNSFLEVETLENDPDDDFYGPLEDGYIVLANHGSGIETVLIVDGKHKGEVWQNNDFGVEKFEDSFIEWYGKWPKVVLHILNMDSKFNVSFLTSNL